LITRSGSREAGDQRKLRTHTILWEIREKSLELGFLGFSGFFWDFFLRIFFRKGDGMGRGRREGRRMMEEWEKEEREEREKEREVFLP
jgi:hypothetical protein